MRPNYAQDAPPTSIEVGGFAYPCETDFRVWIEVMSQMRQINFKAETEAGKTASAEALVNIEYLVFGGWL